jgi:HEXXH motif-containing protein
VLDTLPTDSLAAPGAPGLLEDVVELHAQQVMERVGELRPGADDGRSGSLFDFLERHGRDAGFETAWDPSSGAVHAALTAGGADTAGRLATLALRLHECGAGGEWSCSLPERARLRFDRWPLPRCSRLAVEATGTEVTVLAGGTRLRFVRAAGSWWHDTGALGLPEVRFGGARAIVLRREDLWLPELADLAANVGDAEHDAMATRLGRALELLARAAPAYFAWVRQVLRFVAPWRPESYHRPSGSSSSNLAPGLVGAGNHDHAASLAESLVHEASHHYYYVLSRLGPVDDGSDEALYFNPFFGRSRPVDRILLAYHAFANVLLLCRLAGGEHYFEPRARVVAAGLEEMEGALAGNPALTPLGGSLFTALQRRVHAP